MQQLNLLMEIINISELLILMKYLLNIGMMMLFLQMENWRIVIS